MKTTYRIPTEHPYAFVEMELEEPVSRTVDEIRETYDLFIKAFSTGSGLPDKEWREALDTYLAKRQINGVETWERMNDFQRAVIGELKKSFKRN